VTPLYRPDASRVRGMAALALAVLAAACADAPTQAPASAPSPLMQGSSGGFRAEWTFPLPENSYPGRLSSTPTSIVVPRTGLYRVRVQGTVTVVNNPEYPGPCDVDGVPTAALGTFGPMGWLTPAPFRQRVMVARVNTEPIGFHGYNLGLAEVNSQTIEREVYLPAGQQLHADWTGYPGVVSCSTPDGAGATIPYYLFSGGFTLTVTEVVQQQATLVLECNGARGAVSVERGAALDCQAKAEPEGAVVTDARWTFQDTPGDGPAITGPAGQNAWSGPMVVGGTINLAAKVNGQEQSATAAVTVTKRAWRDELPELRTVYCPAAGVARCLLQNPPVYDKDMGYTALGPGEFTVSGVLVQSGPNTGWHYIPGAQGPIRFTRFTTYLNVVLQDPDNRLFRGGCSATRVTQWIREHENVHVRKFQRAIDQQRMNPELDDVVAFSDTDFQRALRRANARIVSLLSDIGDGNHSDNDYPADPCNLPLRPNPGT
jgi:hypothetical protein